MTEEKYPPKQRERRVTLTDVAARAGVSKMTASRALSKDGKGLLKAETLAAINAAVRDLGYQRDPLASALISGQSKIVAVLVPDLSNAVYADLIAGLQDELADTDLQTIVLRTGFEPEREFAAVKRLAGWKPAAFVLAGSARDPRTTKFLKQQGITTVETMGLPKKPIDMAVGFDHGNAGRMAAFHLFERNYQQPVVLATNKRDVRGIERIEAFTKRWQQLRNQSPDVIWDEREASFDIGTDLIKRQQNEYPACDAVFCVNDLIAVGAYLHCLQTGVDVPGTLAICGFNDLPISAALFGGITTIHSPRREIGAQAARMLIQREKAEDFDPIHPLDCHLIPRATT